MFLVVDLPGTAWKTSFCTSSEEDAWPQDKLFFDSPDSDGIYSSGLNLPNGKVE